VGEHLNVHLASIAFILGGHVAVPHGVPKMADLSFVGVDYSGELVDVAAGFGESLVRDHYVLAYHTDEAVCDGMCGVIEVVTFLHAEKGFCQSRGDWWVMADAVGGDVYAERRWQLNLLDR